MRWGAPQGKPLQVMLIPVLFMTFFLFSGTNFTNGSVECIDYGGDCFASVDEIINETPQINESEFVEVQEYLNATEEFNKTMPEPEFPPDESNSTETTEEAPDELPTEENLTISGEFVDVDEFFNSTEEANKTVEEFLEVDNFLNLTNQTEPQGINESVKNETFAPLNLTAVNDSRSRINSTDRYSVPFTLIDANGQAQDATVSFTKDGKKVLPAPASPTLTSASVDAATTKFGIAPGKYDLRVILPKPAQPADAVLTSPSSIPVMIMGEDSGGAATSSKDAALPVPVSEVLFRDVEITSDTNPILKLEGLPASATPFGKNTRQAYAIDPTQFTFSEGELTVTARGTELYKCAEWVYDEQKCTGKWLKVMDIVPGEEYTILFNATDPAYAEYNSTLGAPRCANYTSPCIATSSLLRSRDSLATAEPNQPNTVDACTDGGSGTYMSDESVENITIESLTSPTDIFNAGDLVRVNATVYCWNDGSSDNLNLVYANDASSPSWTVKNYSNTCIAGGFVSLSGTFVLDNNPGEHVVRVIIQYNGNTADTCGTGAYDDNDDLVFQVNGTPPTVNLVSPTEDALTDGNMPYFTFNVTEASTCTLYIDGNPDQGSISAAADTNYAIHASPLSGAHTWQVICGAIQSEVRNFTQSSRKAIFEDTFSSAGGFSPDATNSAPWQRGNATQMSGCHLDSSCWATGLAVNYNAAGPYSNYLRLRVANAMNFSNYENVTLTFYHYRYIEDATTIFDAGVVDLQNGTNPWGRITPNGGYTGTVNNGFSNPIGGQEGYGNHGSYWELVTINLTNYSLGNESIRFRFYFAVDSSVNDRGWFIDDVRVFGDPLTDYGITAAWDTSDSQTVIPNETNTFYANYTYFNGTPISGPSGTCNITTNATYNMAYNAALGLYEFNQSFPAAVSATAIITCKKNSSFIISQESEDYTITDVAHTNLTCWEAPDPTYPPYPGGYTPTFLYCNYSYLNNTPVDSDGVCSWKDNQSIDYYFFGDETFNMRETEFSGEKQMLFSFDSVWSDLESISGFGKMACYNQTAGTMVVDMCLDYLNTSKSANYNLNTSNDSANCFPVGTMTCAQFSQMSGLPNGTFSWASMAINMTKFNQTLAFLGDPTTADIQFTYWCPDCNFSLFTTPYNTSQYAANLVALHHFDEFVNNGTEFIAVDAAGNVNLTRVGTVYISPGQVNNSVNFSNAHGYLIGPDVTGFDVLSAITVEAYVKVEQNTLAQRTILGKYAFSPVDKCGPNMDQSCLNQRSSRLYLDKEGHLGVDFTSDGKEDGKVTLRDPVYFPLNQWVHVGFVFNGTHIRLYRDGLVVAETEEFSGKKLFDSTAPWLVGADDAGQSGFANYILVDELRVLDVGLSDLEFVSHMNSDFWLIKSQAIPGNQYTHASESISANKRNFTRVEPEEGQNLVKLSVVGSSINMSFNASTGLYTSTRGSVYGFHPNIYHINYSCSKSGAVSQEATSPWTIAALAPNCSIDGYLANVGIGQYQYVNWSFNSNIPPQKVYFNITHEDGHVFTFYDIQLVNATAAINHAPGTANITCYVENENSSYTETVQFNIINPTECFWAAAQNTVYTLGGNLVNTKLDSACITIESCNITIDCNGYSITGNGTDTTMAFLLSAVENITIRNCRMSNYTYGIYGTSGTTATIQNNTFWNLSKSGISITDSGGACSIWNNTFENMSTVGLEIYNSTGSDISWNNFTNASWGILLGYSDGNSIHNNNIFNSTAMGLGFCIESSNNDVRNNNIFNSDPALCPADYGQGIALGFNWPYAELNVSNNFVQNNTVIGYTMGIQSTNSTNNTFRYNVIQDCVRGFEFHRGGNHQAYSNNLSNNSESGIFLTSSSYNILEDNLIYNNAHGYRLEDNSNYNNLTGNEASNNSHCGFHLNGSSYNILEDNLIYNDIHGYHLEGNSNYNNLTNNTARNNSLRGFYLETSSYNTLTNNTGHDNLMSGFSIRTNSHHNVLTGNKAYNNTDVGFRLNYNSTYNNFTDNQAYENLLNGIWINASSSYNIFINNSIHHNDNYGLFHQNSSYNLFVNNSIYNNVDYGGYLLESTFLNFTNNTVYENDLRGFSLDSNSHNNRFINNTVHNNSQQGFFTTDCSHNIFDHNIIYGNSQGIYIFYGSNNSMEYNEIYSAGSSVAGFRIRESTGNSMAHNIVYQNLRGFRIQASHNSSLYNNTVYNNTDSGIRIDSGSRDNNVTNCTSYDNAVAGFYTLDAGTGGNRIINSVAYGNPYGFAILGDNEILINASGHNNTVAGLAITNTHGVYVDPSYFCNNPIGINITTSNNTVIDDSVACNNTQYGIYIENSNNTLINRSKTYNNSMDFLVDNTAGCPVILNFTSMVFDNPSNSLQNYTNLSLYDSVADSTAYSINWTSRIAPPGYINFANKWINISTAAGIPSIDEVTWHWLDSELPGYTESKFELWKYNSSGWLLLNASPDTSTNTILQYNMNPASDYGILENNSTECVEITLSGSYQLSGNAQGSPYNASPLVGSACVKIAASDVVFDCNGYTITNNGTAGTTRGIMTNGSFVNVTVRNCPGISGYTYGADIYTTNSSLVSNLTVFNSSYGIRLTSGYNNTIRNSTAYDITFNGFYMYLNEKNSTIEDSFAHNCLSGFVIAYSSANNTIRNSTSYDNFFGFLLSFNAFSNLIANNKAYDNTDGYSLDSVALNLFENNLAYENDDGFGLSSANNNTFINSSAYNHTYSGFTLSGGDGNRFINITSQNNTDDGFYATDSSNLSIDPSKLKDNGANGVNLNNCEDVLLEDVAVNDNKGHGLHMVNVERTNILNSEFCNNHQFGIRLHHSLDTNITYSLICNNSEDGLRSDDSNNTKSLSNNITNNTLTGVYLDSDSKSNSFNDTFVCFNGFDIHNSSSLSTGALDVCDSYANWTENGHLGCTFKCTDIWQHFYGTVNGSLMLAPNQADIFYSWLWNGDSGAVYVISGTATIDWPSLIALGRNTSQQNSTNDFTELDTLLGISAEPDNVNYTYSYDGSNPNLTMNVTIFEHFVPYVPLANSTFTPGDEFFTGIIWDSSQDTSGNGQFDIADNEDVVFGSGIDGSATYDYEIMVPATLATYKGGTTVEFWVELD